MCRNNVLILVVILITFQFLYFLAFFVLCDLLKISTVCLQCIRRASEKIQIICGPRKIMTVLKSFRRYLLNQVPLRSKHDQEKIKEHRKAVVLEEAWLIIYGRKRGSQ